MNDGDEKTGTWVSVWGYESLDFAMFPICMKPMVQQLTLYNFPRCHGLRLRFQNVWGTEPILISRAYLRIGEGEEVCGITAGGTGSFAIKEGARFWSDPVSCRMEAGQKFQVILEFKEQVPVLSACTFLENDMMQVEHFRQGDSGSEIPAEIISEFTERHPDHRCVIGMDQVAVLTEERTITVAAFGDSITHMSRWTAPLSRRMLDRYGGTVVLMNCGISGNRLLHGASRGSGHGNWFGPSGLSRFEGSVFDNGFHSDRVILFEGINDILHPGVAEAPPEECVAAEEIVRGLEACADIAHRHGIPVWVGTLMPFNGCKDHWRPWHEEKRLLVNRLLKESQMFDGLLDFDEWTRDSGDFTRLDSAGGSEDNLHPGVEGGKRMAARIPLERLVDWR